MLLYDSKLHLFPSKLKSRWTGPFTIQEVYLNGSIDLLNSKDNRVQHSTQQTRKRFPSLTPPPPPPPPPMNSKDYLSGSGFCSISEVTKIFVWNFVCFILSFSYDFLNFFVFIFVFFCNFSHLQVCFLIIFLVFFFCRCC